MKILPTLLLSLFAIPAFAQPDAEAHMEAATAAYNAGIGTVAKYGGVMDDYKLSEKLDDTDPRLYVSRSALRITDGNYKAGLRDADKAIELDPKDADAWYNRAWALFQGKDEDAALKSVRKALDFQPQFPEALYLSGVIKGAQYNEKDGVVQIEQALAMKPSIPGALMSMAVLLFESKRYEEAIPKFTEVIANDTTELGNAYYYRADSYYNLGDKEHACEDWLKSMRMGDKDAAYIKRNYCDTDAKKIPKKPKRTPRKHVVSRLCYIQA